MGSTVDSTLSVIDTGSGHEATPGSGPALYVLIEARRPWAGSSRHSLETIDTIEIGRGSGRSSTRSGRTLTISIPDRWMSSQHATIERRIGRWVLRDRDSKNGTSVNGAAVRSQALVEGDVVGVGHTLLRLRETVSGLGDEPADVDSSDASWGHPALATMVPSLGAELAQAARLARAADIPFLIRGESGTGKEVLAGAVHSLSERSGDLVAVNCGAIPANLIESELFGHVRGAFSGAITDKLGLIRSADGGTLLLDEIGDLALPSQAALLRVLQEREVLAVGAARPVSVDLRVLSATHRDLDSMVARGEFRGDLYARLAGYSVTLPALRDRIDDIGLLVGVLLTKLIGENTSDHQGMTIDCAQTLVAHRWPMNVRELEATLRAAVALAGSEPIGFEHLPAQLRDPARISDDKDSALRSRLEDKLREHRGNISAVARDLGKDRKQVHRWLSRFGLDAATYR